MKRQLATASAGCVLLLTLLAISATAEEPTSAWNKAGPGGRGRSSQQQQHSRIQSATQPSMSFSTLASFAKKFWTAVATVADDESRLKRDSLANETDASGPDAKVLTTTPPDTGSDTPSELTTHITRMLTQIANATTKQRAPSGNSSGIAVSANANEQSTSGSDDAITSTVDTTDEDSTSAPTAFHVESASIFAMTTPSPRRHTSSAPARLSTHHHTGFGCNDSSHALVEERSPPLAPSTEGSDLVEWSTSTSAALDNKLIDSFLKTNLPEIVGTSTSATVPTLATTRKPTTQGPAPTRRRPQPTRAPITTTTTTPTPTSAPATTTPVSPAAVLSQLVNMSSSNDATLSMASIIKAITTAMVMVNENLEAKLTTKSTAGNETQRPNSVGESPASTPATSSPFPVLITTPAATGSPPATTVMALTPTNELGGSPLSQASGAQVPSSLNIPITLSVPLRPFPSIHKSGLTSSDDLHFVSDDNLDEHRDVSNDVDDKDDKFETAEVVKDEEEDQQSITKRDGGPNSILRTPIKNATDEAGECFFDETDQGSMCGWNFTSLSSVRWSFGLGETAYMNGGPIRDSNGMPTGGYAFIDTSTGLIGASTEIQRATLESPSLAKTVPSGRCFTFWYNIGGLSTDRLRVLLVSEEDYTDASFTKRLPSFQVLWEQKDSTNHTWLKGEILYTFAKQHRLIFEGFARSGSDPRRKFQGFMAVDDMAMDSDSCLSFCTFEGHLCGWENDGDSDNFQWQLGRGSLSHLTGPVRDHGDGPEGGYMVIDSAYPRRPGDIARLTSPDLPSTNGAPVCFKFWTHMYGNGIGTLKVLLKTDGESKTIWEVSGESGNSWHMAQVTVSSPDPYKIALEGMVGKNSLGSIAIDDLSFGPGPCPSSPQSALPSRGDCTFEADECGWINAGSGDQYDWLRTSAGQPLLPGQGPNSGYRPPEPLSDHTTGLSTGFYLTMERSTIPPRSGEQAYIVGPTLQGSEEGKCLSFWAYMHERSVDASGPGLGSLRIYLRIGTSSILRPIWRLINFEYPDWFFAQTHIKTTDKFQIVIGGTWGSTRQGAISVDDFTFYDGNCSVLPVEAQVTAGECTFDSNLCEWSSIVNASKERTSWQLATNIRRPSNLDDHTYRAIAGYVFFDIFSQQPHLVRLESPDIVVDNTSVVEPEAEVRCLTFWFAAFGSSRNTFLRVLQRDVASNNETQIWEVTTANFQIFRPEWNYGQVAVTNNATHKIIFEGSSNNGGFAVDDVMFIPGFCQSRPDN